MVRGLFLGQAWNLILREDDTDWIHGKIARAQRRPDELYAGVGPNRHHAGRELRRSAPNVSVRAQSRCHSHSTASQLIGVTPAYSMRWTAMSCASMDTPPEASVTAWTHSHRLAPEYRHFPTDLGPERGNAQLFPSCLLHRLDDALVLPSVDEAAIERL